MKITTAWAVYPGESSPQLISAYDDLTADNWGDVPEFHREMVASAVADGARIRECNIEIHDSLVTDLFAIPTFVGVVKDA